MDNSTNSFLTKYPYFAVNNQHHNNIITRDTYNDNGNITSKNKREFRLVNYSHGVDYLPWAATDSYSEH